MSSPGHRLGAYLDANRHRELLMPSQGAYGANINAGRNANADNGWGSYKWPSGVPAKLLGTAIYEGSKSTAKCSCRVELVELFELAWAIADRVHGYTIYGTPNPNREPTWGPWGYENRPIGGTQTASNHSRGRAFDANAPRNPQSSSFSSDMPVAMVRDFELMGFYWGGRYGGGTKYDTMHFEYCLTPNDVAESLRVGTNILRGANIERPPTTGPGGGTDTTEENIMAQISEERFAALERSVDGIAKFLQQQFGTHLLAQGQSSVGGTIADTRRWVGDMVNDLRDELLVPGVADGQSTVGGTIANTRKVLGDVANQTAGKA